MASRVPATNSMAARAVSDTPGEFRLADASSKPHQESSSESEARRSAVWGWSADADSGPVSARRRPPTTAAARRGSADTGLARPTRRASSAISSARVITLRLTTPVPGPDASANCRRSAQAWAAESVTRVTGANGSDDFARRIASLAARWSAAFSATSMTSNSPAPAR